MIFYVQTSSIIIIHTSDHLGWLPIIIIFHIQYTSIIIIQPTIVANQAKR